MGERGLANGNYERERERGRSVHSRNCTVARGHRCHQPTSFPRFSSRHVDPSSFLLLPLTFAVLIATIIRGNEWLVVVVLKGKHNHGRPNVSPPATWYKDPSPRKLPEQEVIPRSILVPRYYAVFGHHSFYHASSSSNEFFLLLFNGRSFSRDEKCV